MIDANKVGRVDELCPLISLLFLSDAVCSIEGLELSQHTHCHTSTNNVRCIDVQIIVQWDQRPT